MLSWRHDVPKKVHCQEGWDFGQLPFILAFARNAPLHSCHRTNNSVHPRVCGEHLHPQARRDGELGSSPRLRGTHREDRASHTGDRFIPAFAGNTQAWTGTRRFVPVHPRVCGEHNQLDASLFAAAGSSPRLRGTLLLRLGRLDPRRFIPAFAGNTRRSSGPRAGNAVHPRVCGEHHRRQVGRRHI